MMINIARSMHIWPLLAISLLLISSLAGCVFPSLGKFNFYEGNTRSPEELALIDFCNSLFRHFPFKHVITIDGEDLHSAARSHSTSLGTAPCRAWILAGEHQIYFHAKGSGSRDLAGERSGTPATLKALVTFEAGKTYYFIYDSTGGWPFPVATGVWIEDDEGNVIAGEKVKAFGRH
jgi:hypothetical protein